MYNLDFYRFEITLGNSVYNVIAQDAIHGIKIAQAKYEKTSDGKDYISCPNTAIKKVVCCEIIDGVQTQAQIS